VPDTITEALVSAAALVAVALLSYKGIKLQAKAAKDANRDTVTASEQETAVHALESMTLNLLEPYREEVDLLRRQIKAIDEERADERRDRERKAREIQDQIAKQSERIDLLTIEVKHWKSMARAIARWATTLRDQVISLGGTVPTIPDELLMAQLLEERDEP
tara:strand:+ start:564 stop:1049 length:486 start_codon:yes stop_codon:yes gene_type:complete